MPDSITAPANSSVTRSQICATTPRSWVTKMTAVRCASCTAANKPQDLLLHRHVERRCRFVGDDDLGLERESRGDQDALAHAAGQVGADRRAAPARGRAICTSASNASARLRASRAFMPRRSRRPSVSCSLDAPARIERGHRDLAGTSAMASPKIRAQVALWRQCRAGLVLRTGFRLA